MLINDAFKAFASGAGLSANYISLFVRTSLLILFFMWAAWTALELLKYYKQHSQEHVSALLGSYIQLFFLVSVVIALVFIP